MATEDNLLLPREVTHPRLPAETTWIALGDLSLLDATDFIPVILSRSLMPAKIDAETKRIAAAVRQGAVAVGGFISFAEKKAARQLAALPELRLIRVLPHPLIDYPLTDAVRDRIRKGRTLILSGIGGADKTLTRANCVRTNGWVLNICEAATAPAAPLPAQKPTPVVEAKQTPAPPPTPAPKQKSTQTPPAPAPADDPAAIFL